MLPTHQELSWQKWLRHALKYEKAVGGGKDRPSRLSPAIQYNLIALALESYVMAMVSFHGDLPENHTFTDLIDAWEKIEPLDPQLKSIILKYEDMQSICSLDNYHRRDLSETELQELRHAVSTLGKIVTRTCPRPASAMAV